MKIEKMTENAASAWNSYKRHDPVMLRKTLCMRDSLYRKSEPEKELWHTEVNLDLRFYAAVVAGILIMLSFLAVMCGVWHRLCRPFCRKKR